MIMIGDEVEILMKTDLMIEMRDIRDSDHVLYDIMYLVEQNGIC